MRLAINSNEVTVPSDWMDSSLLMFLREFLGLTGSKFGCGQGQCGACTVLLDDQPVRSCLLAVSELANYSITTIEGLALNEELHPLQKAWIDYSVAQCGYCQAGQIMSACGLLKRNASPTKQDIAEALNGNLCRCGSYQRIVEAVDSVVSKTPLYKEVF